MRIRGTLLRRVYRPRPFEDKMMALALVGAPADVQRSDVVAYVYPSWRAQRAFQRTNLRRHGHVVLGAVELEEGVLGVIDLRPAIEAAIQRREAARASD